MVASEEVESVFLSVWLWQVNVAPRHGPTTKGKQALQRLHNLLKLKKNKTMLRGVGYGGGSVDSWRRNGKEYNHIYCMIFSELLQYCIK